MKYDDASWHYGADNFPDHLPPLAGAVHIGLFAAWLALNDLMSDELIEDDDDELEALTSREQTPASWFCARFDEKLTDGDLSGEGNAFAEAYYVGEAPQYMADYDAVFTGPAYGVVDSWENFDRLAPRISAAFAKFREG